MTKYTNLEVLKNGLSFYRNAQTIYDVQSPYLYSLLKALIDNHNLTKPLINKIERLRGELMKNQENVKGEDYGAGSRINHQKKTIGSIVTNSSSNKKAGIILHNLVKYSKASTVLELGTNLGIGTAYLASVNENIDIHTIEGNKNIAEIAKQNFRKLGLNNIHTYQGTFKQVIPQLFIENIDIVFIDGHHDGQATIEYVEMLRPLMKEPGLMVLDDIYWSTDMQKAFQYLIQQPYVSSFINLYHKGILIFNSDLKQTPGIHYLPYLFKPWRIGLWGGKHL